MPSENPCIHLDRLRVRTIDGLDMAAVTGGHSNSDMVSRPIHDVYEHMYVEVW